MPMPRWLQPCDWDTIRDVLNERATPGNPYRIGLLERFIRTRDICESALDRANKKEEKKLLARRNVPK